MDDRSRRAALLAGAGALAALAGCRGRSGETPTGSTPTDTVSDEAERGAGGETDDSSGDGTGDGTDELDLREANVVGVAFEADGGYRFSVTLYHDDDGEEGYANWWQVERLDGTRLGRRTLFHAHSTEPFTRSERIDVPEGVTCVVVRGHDQTHGYGGRATLVNLDSGATRAVDQGATRRSFAASACP